MSHIVNKVRTHLSSPEMLKSRLISVPIFVLAAVIFFLLRPSFIHWPIAFLWLAVMNFVIYIFRNKKQSGRLIIGILFIGSSIYLMIIGISWIVFFPFFWAIGICYLLIYIFYLFRNNKCQ